MKKLQKINVIVFVSVISLAGLSTARAENSNGDSGTKAQTLTNDQFQVTFNRSADGYIGEHFSYQVKPSSVNDPGRPLPHYRSLLPVCTQPQDVTCIESVESKPVSEESWTKATLSANQFDESKISAESRKGYFEYGTWPADKAAGMPAGGVASVWDMPKTAHSNGFSYVANVQYLGQFNNGTQLSEFSVMLEPWSWACATYNSCNFVGSVSGSGKNVFSENVEFRITIRTNFLGSKIGSWAVGRLGKPTVNFTSEKLVISGSPVTYPMASATLPTREECNLKIGATFKKHFPNAPNLCTGAGQAFSTDSNDLASLDLFSALDELVRQDGAVSRWTFSNVKDVNSSNKCIDSQGFSLATSNAMLYSVQPPVWNSKDGTLGYRLASTHADADGKLNKGNYSLALSKKMADCLWNFDTKKASAVLSITNDAGVQNIAISTLRTTPNWVYFDASGFTFSSPEIKVKLINPSSKIETKTINCYKGSVIKKIVGKNPVCPNGYKIKK